MIRRLDLPDTASLQESTGKRLTAPSAERNAGPLLDQLQRLLPPDASVLELASGTGQHAAYFARAMPGLIWHPSDLNTDNFASIESWAEGIPNIRAPLRIDAGKAQWSKPLGDFDAVFVVNLLHLISAQEAQNVIAGMADVIRPGGSALVYGPFRREGALTGDGDIRFDASLRAQDPEIGYKDTVFVRDCAESCGLSLEELIEMPANNLLLAFRRSA